MYTKYFSIYSIQIYSTPFHLPPEWLLRIETHLHCSTLASLLLEPNTVLGPMYLVKKGPEELFTETTSTSYSLTVCFRI